MTTFTGEQLRTIGTFLGIKLTIAALNLRITQPAYCKPEQQASIPEPRWRQIMQALAITEHD